jgi:hypothetical protein
MHMPELPLANRLTDDRNDALSKCEPTHAFLHLPEH